MFHLHHATPQQPRRSAPPSTPQQPRGHPCLPLALTWKLCLRCREAKDAAKKSGDLEPDRPLQAIAVKLPEDRRQEAAERMTATLAGGRAGCGVCGGGGGHAGSS